MRTSGALGGKTSSSCERSEDSNAAFVLAEPRVQAIDSRKIESPGRHDASPKKPEFSWCQKNRERLSLAVLPPQRNSDLFGVLESWRFILRTGCSIDSTWSRSMAHFSRIDSSRYF